MTKIANDTRLDCWLHAKSLAVQLYNVSQNGNLSRDSFLKNQLRKTAVLVASHISVGKKGKRSKDLLDSFRFAASLAEELRTQLAISRDVGYLSEGDFLDLEDQTVRLISLLGRSVKKRKS